MTPKEKAKELLDRYNHVVNGYVVIDNNTFEHLKNIGYDKAKQCALIAVDEILKMNPHSVEYVEDKYDPLQYSKIFRNTCEFWQEVKQEIENL